MGLFGALSKLFGGHAHKDDKDAAGADMPAADGITADRLADMLRGMQTERNGADFVGICSKGVDCLYFVRNNGAFDIEYEALSAEQLPYLDGLKRFAAERGYRVEETTYGNTPEDYDHLKCAPVLALRMSADAAGIAEIGREIENTVFGNCDDTVYETVR